ncbi:MAG: hypothetical protein ABIB79_03680 [archaeon]
MKPKYENILKEVLDEIEIALKDSKGIISHQRRIAFSLSLGAVTLIEEYLDRLNILKPGAKINHLWLKKKRETVKEYISRQISAQIDSIPKIDQLIELAFELEKDRNILAYGKPVSELKIREKIGLFLKLKKEVEDA